MTAPAASLRRLTREALFAAERRLVPVAVARPRLAMALASGLGAVRHTLSRRWPSPDALRAVLAVAPRRGRALARRIAGTEARHRVLVAAIARGGPAVVGPLLAIAPQPALPAPAILVTFHVGAWCAVAAMLAHLRVQHAGLGWAEVGHPADGLERRAAALAAALAELARGGRVVTAADGESGAAIAARCCGRSLAFGRGTFFLARRGGAPVVPLVLRWCGTRLVLDLDRSCLADPAADEELQAAALAGWLERYLHAHPEQLGLGLLRRLAGEA